MVELKPHLRMPVYPRTCRAPGVLGSRSGCSPNQQEPVILSGLNNCFPLGCPHPRPSWLFLRLSPQLPTPVQVAEARERTPPPPAHKGQKELSLREFTLSRTHLAFIIIDNIILGLGIKRPIKTSA